jgi:hypothetical protein
MAWILGSLFGRNSSPIKPAPTKPSPEVLIDARLLFRWNLKSKPAVLVPSLALLQLLSKNMAAHTKHWCIALPTKEARFMFDSSPLKQLPTASLIQSSLKALNVSFIQYNPAQPEKTLPLQDAQHIFWHDGTLTHPKAHPVKGVYGPANDELEKLLAAIKTHTDIKNVIIYHDIDYSFIHNPESEASGKTVLLPNTMAALERIKTACATRGTPFSIRFITSRTNTKKQQDKSWPCSLPNIKNAIPESLLSCVAKKEDGALDVIFTAIKAGDYLKRNGVKAGIRPGRRKMDVINREPHSDGTLRVLVDDNTKECPAGEHITSGFYLPVQRSHAFNNREVRMLTHTPKRAWSEHDRPAYNAPARR